MLDSILATSQRRRQLYPETSHPTRQRRGWDSGRGHGMAVWMAPRGLDDAHPLLGHLRELFSHARTRYVAAAL
jgi:hypothetical protein